MGSTTSQPCIVCGAPHDRAAIRLSEPLLFGLALELRRQGGLNVYRPPNQTPTCRRGHPLTAATVLTRRPGRANPYTSEGCKVCKALSDRRSGRRHRRTGVAG